MVSKLASGAGQSLVLALLGLALFWVATVRIATTVWIGNFTLNAYLTGIAAVAAGLLALLTVALLINRSIRTKNFWGNIPKLALLGALSGLPFLAYGVVWLLSDFRLQGLQNLLVWATFSLSVFSLAFWITPPLRQVIGSTLRFLVFWIPLIKIVSYSIGFTLTELVSPYFFGRPTLAFFDFYGRSSYAIVAVFLLSWAVAQKPEKWFDWVSPWLVLLSVIMAQGRTPAVVAFFLMLFLAHHLPWRKSQKLMFFIAAGLLSVAAAWVIMPARFEGLSSSGRFEGWLYLLARLPEGPNFLGQGAGLSSFLVNDLLGYHHPHNEYLRIFFDFGLVGFVLFLSGATVLWTAAIYINKKFRTRASVAPVLLIPAVGLIAITDNPLIFISVMLPTAIVIAASLSKSLPSLVTPKANRETKSAQ